MIHLDLFSGIGGFAIAVDEVWGRENVEHIFCDIEPFAQEVLKKHWPGSYIYDDIRSITNTTGEGLEGSAGSGEEGRTAGRSSSPGERPFILTGGFPCQPFSAAGLRRGTADDRHLWPEMLRVIRLTEPQWVIAENVRGLVTWNEGLVLEQVCSDLEAAGYEVQPLIIPAVAVNAPHRRDRIWFVAHRNNSGERTSESGIEQVWATGRPEREHSQSGAGRQNSNAEDPFSFGSSRQVLERQAAEVQDEGSSWESDWLEVATEFCSVDDGLSVELDGFKLSKSKHRQEQIKAYGNAIVPQVAIEIMRAIQAQEESELQLSLLQ